LSSSCRTYFERGLFANDAARRIAEAIDARRSIPNVDPRLAKLERRGKEKFEFFCGDCHGGPARVREPREPRPVFMIIAPRRWKMSFGTTGAFRIHQ
jgi:hypothetical protein